MIRTHTAGSLRAANVGETVTLAGWVARRRDHGGVAFLDLRDASGVVQVVVRDPEVAHPLRNEFCVKVVGEVSLRPEGNANAELPTGEIEVIVAELEVLSVAAPLPFPIDEHVEVGEEARLRHRYLDLRRPAPGAAIRLRSTVNRTARDVLYAHDFVEIETPTLTRSTPEGARDFLVPARLQPGSWYALPQSPQLFKQLLMVAGMERYFQIARCYRDEDFRADRQPEFTQLDIEMSFIDQDDIIGIGESVVSALWKLIGHEISTPIPRMTYADSMARFGNDKPDLRFGHELVECTDYFADTPFRVFQAPYVGAVVMPGGASQPRKQLDAWQDWAKQRGAKGLAYVLVQEDGELGGPVAKNLSDAERAGLAERVGASAGDCVFFAAGEVSPSRALLGAARLEIGRRCGLIDEAAWSFVWIVDAPLFEQRKGWGCPAPDPIFIVGLPRSGSTLVEQILASHSQVQGTMELPTLGFIASDMDRRARQDGLSGYAQAIPSMDNAALTALGEGFIAATRIYRTLNRPLFIDKMPNNFRHVGLIQLILPNARIIDARRQPLGSCFSSFKQHFAQGQAFSYDLTDLGRYYADYVELMRHYDRALPGRVHRVIYEDMVEDTEAVVRRLLDYCGLPFEEGCLRFYENQRAVRTVSSEQVRRPIFREGLDQWKRFDPWLDPLKSALGPVLENWRD